MKKTILFFVILWALSACTKWVEPDMTSKRIAECITPASASSTSVCVNPGSEEIWKAESMDKWLNVNFKGYVKGEYAVTISCQSNESTAGRRNFARQGRVLIRTYNHTICDTIVVKQAGLTPDIMLVDTSVETSAKECLVPLTTNLTDEQRPSISFSADKAWVKTVSIAPDNVHLLVELAQGASGSSLVTMTYKPVWGDPVQASCTITIKQ